MKKPIVPIIYDFDKTLCTKDMQEYGFIPKMEMKATDFWKKVNDLTDKEEMDNILAYMFMMVETAKNKKIPIKKDDFIELGKEVEYFRGVEGWFDRIDSIGESLGLKVEHYIVSSGIKEIIEGTTIAKFFKEIYACEFMYDYTDMITWPKFAVNYTTKTQFIFRINKGVFKINSNSTKDLNKFTPEKERQRPFRNMIYIGDGITDVPCMKLVRTNGGNSIAVFDEAKGNVEAKELLKNNRVNFIAPADYSKDSEIEQIVQAVMEKVKAVESLNSFEL